MKNLIEVRNLHKAYGNRQVLDGVDFSVKEGTIHGLLGPNGAGKTTTMKVITGLLAKDNGEVFISGQAQDVGRKLSCKVGYLLELPPLYEDMLVEEYLKFVAEIYKYPKDEMKDRVENVIDLFDLGSVRERRIGNLSKGYKQRVGIAQAIIHDPEIVILDEPTLGLDPQTIVEIRNLILKLRGKHTVIVSSHQLHEMSLICEDISIMLNGKVVKSGTLEEITENGLGLHELILETDKSNDTFEEELRQKQWISQVKYENGSYKIIVKTRDEIRPEIIKCAVKNDLSVLSFIEKKQTLEDIFIGVTSRRDH